MMKMMTMMNDYQSEKGAIWEFYYYTKEVIEINPNLEQVLIDNETRSITQDTFNPPVGLSPSEYSQLFIQHFMKTRQKSREIIDENKQKLTRYKVLSQVGNFECLEDLNKTESLSNFHSWENPSLIEYFRELSKKYLYE
jgi:hypothetical protein